MGDKFVDITSGRSRRHVAPDGEVPYRCRSAVAEELGHEPVRGAVAPVDDTMRDIEEGRSQVGQFVLGEDMYNDLRRRTAEIERAMRAAASTTSAVGQALYTDQLYRRISQRSRTWTRPGAPPNGTGQRRPVPGRPGAIRPAAKPDRGLCAVPSRSLRAAEFLKTDRMYQDWNRSLAALVHRWTTPTRRP